MEWTNLGEPVLDEGLVIIRTVEHNDSASGIFGGGSGNGWLCDAFDDADDLNFGVAASNRVAANVVELIADHELVVRGYDVPPDYVPTFMLVPLLETGKVER